MSSSRRRPERRLSIAQGRDAREIQLPPSAGKCFLLTSPFIEPWLAVPIQRLAFSLARWASAEPHECQVQGVGPNDGSPSHRGGTPEKSNCPRRRGSVFS